MRLHEYPTALVKVACKKCARQGQYQKDDLIVRHGAATVLPDVLLQIAKCEKQGNFSDWCGAYYVELAKATMVPKPEPGARFGLPL